MNLQPTINECRLWIVEQCQSILRSLDAGKIDTVSGLLLKVYDIAIAVVEALDVENESKEKLLDQLKRQPTDQYREKTLTVLGVCNEIGDLSTTTLSVIQDSFIREEQRLQLDLDSERLSKTDICADGFTSTTKTASWFRRFFVGKPYITLIGPLFGNASDKAVISIVKEIVDKTRKQYRIILRTKQAQNFNMTFIVNDADVKDLVLQLQSTEQISKLDLNAATKQSRPLRSLSSTIGFSAAHHSTLQQDQVQQHIQNCAKLMRASLLFLFQDVDFSLFEELSAEITILSGLEKELLKYDEIGVPKSFKFGILTIKDGQNTEEEWLGNTTLSAQFKVFLGIIGKPIKLKDYKGYTGGLDTQANESGDVAYVSTWEGYEIIYHVAPLMPSSNNDLQQVHRKRYIGNDITCIIFLEGQSQRFDPNNIRSQFIHIFIIVKHETIGGKSVWRVEVLHRKEVEVFKPFVPSPPLFFDDLEFRDFLLAKLINGEISALESAKFSLPTNKAKLSMLSDLVTTGVAASEIAKHINNGGNTPKDGRWTGKRLKERPKFAVLRADQNSNAMKHDESSSNTTIKSPQLSFAELTLPPATTAKQNLFNEVKSLTRRKSAQPYRRSMKDFSGQFKQALKKGVKDIQQQQQQQQQQAVSPKTDIPDTVNLGNDKDICAESLRVCDSLQNISPNVPTITERTGIRVKAQNLMASMIGRRKTLHKRCNGSKD